MKALWSDKTNTELFGLWIKLCGWQKMKLLNTPSPLWSMFALLHTVWGCFIPVGGLVIFDGETDGTKYSLMFTDAHRPVWLSLSSITVKNGQNHLSVNMESCWRPSRRLTAAAFTSKSQTRLSLGFVDKIQWWEWKFFWGNLIARISSLKCLSSLHWF